MIRDEIDIFLRQHDPEYLSGREEDQLIKLLKSSYPLIVKRNKIRTACEIPDHNRYMRLASLLGKLGYRKSGVWFVREERK